MMTGVGVVFGAQRDPGPRVVALALGCRRRRSASARPAWVACAGSASTRIGPAWVGTRRLADDGQHVAQPVSADAWPQRRVGAVDLVAGHPPCRDLRLTARVISAVASAGLVANSRLSSGIPAAAQRSGSSAQRLGQIQRAVDQGVPARRGIGQIHRHLGVLDPPGGAGVLALHPDRVRRPSSRRRSRRPPAPRPGHRRHRRHSRADRRAPRRRPTSPATAGAATRPGVHVAAVFGDRPAVLAVQPRQHPQHQPGRRAAAARTGQTAARSGRSPRRTPSTTDQGLRYEPRRPRRIRCSSQTPNDAAVTAPTSADTPTYRDTQVTIYGCSTTGASPQPDEACRWSRLLGGSGRVG